MKKIVVILSVGLLLSFVVNIALIERGLGGVRYTLFKLQHGDDANGQSLARADHFKTLTTRGGIIFLGDSIVQQAEWTELLGRPISNRGIGGDTTVRVLNRLDAINDAQPRAVLLMVGVNDLSLDQPAVVARRYTQLVANIRRPAEIYIHSVLPVNNTTRATGISNDKVRQLNVLLSMLTNQRIHYVDLYSSFVGTNGELKPEYTYDGIHLRAEAYKAWSQKLLKLEF